MSKTLVALVLCVVLWPLSMGVAFAQDPDTPFPRSANSQPIEMKIVSAPEDATAHGLLMATWIMVVANVILCAVTWVGARNQSKDMQDSIAVGQKSADAAGRSADAAVRSSDAASASALLAAQQQRDMLQRETNIVAHRVAQMSVRLLDLVELRINLSRRRYREFDSMPEKAKLDETSARTREAAADAEAVLAPGSGPKTDEILAGELRRLDRHQVLLEAFKEQVSDEIVEVRRMLREDEEQARRFQDRAEQQMRDLRNR